MNPGSEHGLIPPQPPFEIAPVDDVEHQQHMLRAPRLVDDAVAANPEAEELVALAAEALDTLAAAFAPPTTEPPRLAAQGAVDPSASLRIQLS
jgi:hypothetical protein